MRFRLCILALAAILGGCSGGAGGSTPAPTTAQTAAPAVAAAPHSYPQGSIKKGDQALCAVCSVNDGVTEKEAAAEVIDYQGKTYGFCNQEEKAQFISNPAKFAAK